MTTILLISIQHEIIRIGYPLIILIGNIGGTIGLFVFLQKSMRRNPCGLFLIAYMITNILYINFTIVLAVISEFLPINPSTQSLIFCRIYYYISFVLAVIPSYLLSMASVDRSLASSRNVRTRLRSTPRFAALMIGIICGFWLVFHLHAFFIVDIQSFDGVQLVCTFLPGIPATFVSYYNLICVGIIPLLLMIGSGIQILMNIKQGLGNRIHLQNNRRLILLLIIQVNIYLCLRLPTSIFLIYKEFTKFNRKSSYQMTVEQFVQSVVYFCQFIQVSISPLLNLTTKTFRNELKQAVHKMTRNVNQT